jgi:hypothetical protein
MGMLLVQIDIRDREIAKLSSENSRLSECLDACRDPATQKIIDLAKKNRSLNVQVESLKSKLRKYELAERHESKQQLAKDKEKEKEREREQLAMSMAMTMSEEKEKSEADEWKQKYDSLFAKTNELQVSVSTLKQENMRIRGLLQREVGDDVDVMKLLKEETNWRGRAQQISLLKAKLASGAALGANRPDTASTVSEQTVKDFVNAKEASRFEELERLRGEVMAKDDEVRDLRAKTDGFKSRISNLESYSAGLKSKIQILLQKTENDDKLINTLREQLRRNGHSASSSNLATMNATGSDSTLPRRSSKDREANREAVEELLAGMQALQAQFHHMGSTRGYDLSEAFRQSLSSSIEVQRRMVQLLLDLASASPTEEEQVLRHALDALSRARQEDLQLFGIVRAELAEQQKGVHASRDPYDDKEASRDDRTLEKENEQLKVEMQELKSRYNSLMARASMQQQQKR